MFDLTSMSSFESVANWMVEASRSCRGIETGEVGQLLAGNKSDLTADRTVTSEQIQVKEVITNSWCNKYIGISKCIFRVDLVFSPFIEHIDFTARVTDTIH